LKTNNSSVWKIFRAFVSKVSAGVKEYVKENWGAPFIVGFMVLLMVAAVFLLMDFAVLANEVAVYAYYALVVGVVLQLVCFLKCRKREGESSQ
jgi:heme/copper-type cytochrome/quinol oxidase subunit 4